MNREKNTGTAAGLKEDSGFERELRKSYNKRKTNPELRGNHMIRLLGPGNDLYTESGKITRTGYIVMAVSSVFGLLCFFIGRSLYGKLLQRRGSQQTPDRPGFTGTGSAEVFSDER